MNNYKLTISYDGTRYHGWQSQKHTEGTVQQKLEDLLIDEAFSFYETMRKLILYI